MEKARVFMNGRSQAVRIPAKFRFATGEVYVQQNEATGELVLSEQKPRPNLKEIFAMLDAAGEAAEIFGGRDPSAPQDREWE